MSSKTLRVAVWQPGVRKEPPQLRRRPPPPAASLRPRPAAQPLSGLPTARAAAVSTLARQLRLAAAVSGKGSTSWLDDGIAARPPENPSAQLFSPDLAPVPEAERTWSGWDMAALWIGLVVSISSW